MTEIEKLRHMTVWDLAALGVADVAYVKAVSTDNGTMVYAIHAADGSELGVMADFETAFAAVRQHGMEPASVH